MADTLQLEQVSFEIILHAGNARSSAMEALQLVKHHECETGYQKIQEAESEPEPSASGTNPPPAKRSTGRRPFTQSIINPCSGPFNDSHNCKRFGERND